MDSASDTSLQELEEELLAKSAHDQHYEERSNDQLNDKAVRVGVSAAPNKIKLQGTTWSPVYGSNRTQSGIPTIAIRVQTKPPQNQPLSRPAIHTAPCKPQIGVSGYASVPPIIVFPSMTGHTGAAPSSAPTIKLVKCEKYEPAVQIHKPVLPSPVRTSLPPQQSPSDQSPRAAVSNPQSADKSTMKPPVVISKAQSELNTVMREKFLKAITSESSTRHVSLTLQRYVGAPREPATGPSEVEYTICSACRKSVPSNRLAIHVAIDHSSPKVVREEDKLIGDVKQFVHSADHMEHDYDSVFKIAEACPICHRRISKDRFYSHLALIHNQHTELVSDVSNDEVARKPFQCLICRCARFALRKNLLRHQQVCGSSDGKTGGFMCEICRACFDDNRSLLQHKTRVHVTQFPCDECPATFGVKRFLAQHKTMKHRKRGVPSVQPANNQTTQPADGSEQTPSQYFCDECSASFRLPRFLAQHKAMKHRKRKIGQWGGKLLVGNAISDALNSDKSPAPNNNINEANHQLTPRVASEDEQRAPTESPKISVETGSKSATSTPKLEEKRRRRTKADDQTGGVPHTCKTCGKIFNSLNYLAEHEDSHAGIRRFKCNICGKAYTFSSALWMHKRSHETDGPQFGCEHCFALFKNKPALNRHKLVTHPDEAALETEISNEHICELCGKGFKNEQALRMHLSRKHPYKPEVKSAATSSPLIDEALNDDSTPLMINEEDDDEDVSDVGDEEGENEDEEQEEDDEPPPLMIIENGDEEMLPGEDVDDKNDLEENNSLDNLSPSLVLSESAVDPRTVSALSSTETQGLLGVDESVQPPPLSAIIPGDVDHDMCFGGPTSLIGQM